MREFEGTWMKDYERREMKDGEQPREAEVYRKDTKLHPNESCDAGLRRDTP